MKESKAKRRNQILVEGCGLKLCMNTDCLVGAGAKPGNIVKMGEVLEVDAAR